MVNELTAMKAKSSFTFLLNGEVIGNGRALMTASIFALCALFVLLTLPETKGKDLD